MKKKLRKSFLTKLKKFCLLTLLTGGLFLTGFIGLIYSGFFGDLPNNEQLSNIKNNLSTEIISADGKVIGKFYLQERTRVSLNEISQHAVNALIATEDVRFYDHSGIDYRSLLRVLIKTVILQQRSGGGGSTITQQLVKNLFPRERHGLLTIPIAKIKEILLATRMEENFSKDELLIMYFNTVPFGDNVFGIEAASRRFFNKKAKALKVKEAAVLIGMLKANYTYNPRIFPEKSLARRNVVLSQMDKYGYLEGKVFEKTIESPLGLNYQTKSIRTSSDSYFKELVRGEMRNWLKSYKKPDGSKFNLYTDGLKIHTTLDSRLQSMAETAIKSHMKELQYSFDQHWKSQKPWDGDPTIFENSLKKLPVYQKLKKANLSEDQILDSLDQRHLASYFSWDGSVEKNLSTIDSLKYYLNILQTGVIAIDPKNGEIKVWIGGNDFNYFKYDHAKESTKRQVGSTFKPIVYAAALANEMDPCEYISASRTVYKDFEGWTPNNSDTTENLKKYSFKGALAHSVNTVTVKVLEKTGINEVIYQARKMGIESSLPPVPSIALGTPSISLMEMTRAYSVFANSGQLTKAKVITKITDHEGTVLAEFQPSKPEQVLSHETAVMITDMLREAVDHGTGGRIRWKYQLKNELAGKTGTTQSNADGWFIGYSPDLVVGVWVGADDPRIRFRSTSLGSGSNMALPIFAKIFQQINKEPTLSKISHATFDEMPAKLVSKLACDNEKEDKNFLNKLFGNEKEEKIKEKKFGEEKKSLFDKIGSLFGKKKKK